MVRGSMMFHRGEYPNPEGMVKCVYCQHLKVGNGDEGASCLLTKARVFGIGCLVRCERFKWSGVRGETGCGDDDVSGRVGW